MATLTGQYISQSYGGVINLSTNTGIVTGSSTQLQDGFGTNLGIYLNGSGTLSSSADIQVNSINIGKGRDNATANLVISSLSSANATPGTYNTIIGYNSGVYMTSSNFNTVVGTEAMGHIYYIGSANTAIGTGAGANFRGQSNNTVIGRDAGGGYLGGEYNIFLGVDNGTGGASGNYNVVIGNLVRFNSVSNNIIIADGSGSIRARYNSGWNLSGGAVSASSFEAASFTGSLFGTASWASNAISSSYALNATNAVNATTASYIATASYALNSNLLDGLDSSIFATTGSNTFKATQIISGSVINEVKVAPGSSNTASLDLSTGNFFTLTLVNGVTTHISASNVQRGQTVQLQITQPAGVGSVSFSNNFTFPSGSSYVAFASASAVDVLSFISFNGSTLRGVAQYNFI